MASNPYVNKVVNAETNATIIDLTADTALASDVAAGKYFHLATGERVQGGLADGNSLMYGESSYLVGTAKTGTGYTWTTVQDPLEIGRGLIDEGRVA